MPRGIPAHEEVAQMRDDGCDVGGLSIASCLACPLPVCLEDDLGALPAGEAERIGRAMLAQGVSVYRVAGMTHADYDTVRRWAREGRGNVRGR